MHCYISKLYNVLGSINLLSWTVFLIYINKLHWVSFIIICSKVLEILRDTRQMVHIQTTDEWHADDMQLHTSDIRVLCKNIRVTYGWHSSTYQWLTDVIRVHMSVIRKIYGYMRVAYERHTRHTSDIRKICRWYTGICEWLNNDIKNI